MGVVSLMVLGWITEFRQRSEWSEGKGGAHEEYVGDVVWVGWRTCGAGQEDRIGVTDVENRCG